MRLSLWIACCAALALFGGCGASLGSLSQKEILVMTYNIHHGVGTDSAFDIKRIAKVIQRSGADIVALQNIDRWVNRTEKMDMMTTLADLTGMTYTFVKSRDLEGGEHGNGLLTRFPILEEKPVVYNVQASHTECSLMRLVLDVRGTEIVLMNTELYGDGDDSVLSANTAEIIAASKEYLNLPVILCGSLKSLPDSKSIATLAEDFTDCWTISGTGEGFTFPSDASEHRYDYIFVSRPRVPTDTRSPEVSLKPIQARVYDSRASDHLPLVVTLKVVSE